MRATLTLALALGCTTPKPEPSSASASASATPISEARLAVAQSADLLYEHAESLEKEGLWEEAASAYQRYLFAKGDSLSYIRRSSLEVRIKQLREKRRAR